MKIIRPFYAVLRLAIIVMLLGGAQQMAYAAEVYAQLSNTGNQLTETANINKPTPIVIQKVNNISGMEWDAKLNTLTIKEDGIYTVISELQCGTRESYTVEAAGGDFYYWIEANGKELTNTGNWIHVDPQSKSNTIGNYFVLPLIAGTHLRFMFATTIADIGVVSFQGTELRPASPGLTVSIFKVGDIPGASITSATAPSLAPAATTPPK